MRGPECLSLTYWLAMAAITVMMFTGCQGGPSQRKMAAAEPSLSPSVSSGGVVVEGLDPAEQVDRDRVLVGHVGRAASLESRALPRGAPALREGVHHAALELAAHGRDGARSVSRS